VVGDFSEFLEVPSWDFEGDVVECRFEKRARGAGYRIFDFWECFSAENLCGDECEGVAGGFRCESGGSGEASVDFDDAVFAVVVRIESVLDVAFADDSEVADGFLGDGAEHLVLAVCQSLARRNDDRFAGVDAERVEVFHVDDGNAVVGVVADDFVLDFFPATEVFFDENLRRKGERFAGVFFEFFGGFAKPGAFSAESKSGADDAREADFCNSDACLIESSGGNGSGSFDSDFGTFFHKNLAILGGTNDFERSTEDFYSVFFEDAGGFEFEGAVECGLPSE